MFTYGNYCGPYWSDGQWQTSVVGSSEPIDELDALCRNHDQAYAEGNDLYEADKLFAKRAIVGHGVRGVFYGALVGTQAALRASELLITEPKNMNNTKPRLRGTQPQEKIKKQTAPPKSGMMTSLQMAPTSIGTQIRGMTPSLKRNAESATLSGRDFIGTVEGNGVTAFGVGKSALLSPAYFATTHLGNLSRSFERYRWRKLRIHYVPKVPTSITGQIVLTSSRSVTEPALIPESGTFLPKALSQGNAVFSPLWTPCYIDIDCDLDWKLVDPATSADIDDAIHEELIVYTQVSVAQQVGYLVAEYEVDFREPVYQAHSTNMPIPTGMGTRVVLTDTAGVNAANDDWSLSVSSGFNLVGFSNGTIYRAVFDQQGSTPATGTTFSNALVAITAGRTNTTTIASVSSNISLDGGSTFYLVVFGNVLYAYTSVEAAINGNGTGQLFFRAATTVAGLYSFDAAIIRYGTAVLPSVQ